jgi:hypothetical protein
MRHTGSRPVQRAEILEIAIRYAVISVDFIRFCREAATAADRYKNRLDSSVLLEVSDTIPNLLCKFRGLAGGVDEGIILIVEAQRPSARIWKMSASPCSPNAACITTCCGRG